MTTNNTTPCSILIDKVSTEMNACSLECLWWKSNHFLPISNTNDNNDELSDNCCDDNSSAEIIVNKKKSISDETLVLFPVIVGCYQLVDAGGGSTTNSLRSANRKHEDSVEKEDLSEDEKGADTTLKEENINRSNDDFYSEEDNNDDNGFIRQQQKRIGQLRTYTMKYWFDQNEHDTSVQSFNFTTKNDNQTSSTCDDNHYSDEGSYSFKTSDQPPQICHIDDGGVLDCKWCPHPTTLQKNVPSKQIVQSNLSTLNQQSIPTSHNILASALSSGDIGFHLLNLDTFSTTTEKDNILTSSSLLSSSSIPYFSLRRLQVKKSFIPKNDLGDEEETISHSSSFDSSSSSCSSENMTSQETICLSLDWSSSLSSSSCTSPSSEADNNNIYNDQLVSSYSNGQLVVHSVSLNNTSISSNNANDEINVGSSFIDLTETHRWNAHSLFGGTPSEVWTCCWGKQYSTDESSNSNSNMIISGGDDGTMKGWDIRTVPYYNNQQSSSLTRPIFCIGDEEFGAGVTAVTWHPLYEHYFVCGSYDEGVRLWDIRMLTSSRTKRNTINPVAKIDSCGGGIWRLKFHPIDTTKLLVAAMHGGCCVLHIDISNVSTTESINTSAFIESTTKLPSSTLCQMNIISTFDSTHKSMAYGADWLPSSMYYSSLRNDFKSKINTKVVPLVAASCSFYDQLACTWKV